MDVKTKLTLYFSTETTQPIFSTMTLKLTLRAIVTNTVLLVRSSHHVNHSPNITLSICLHPNQMISD
nr:MAG TPA: hypothetical protein [Caudoviricetes sp.]